MESLAPLGAILALAFLAEGLTEYFFSDLLTAKGIDTKYLRYIAALVLLHWRVDSHTQALATKSRVTVGKVA